MKIKTPYAKLASIYNCPIEEIGRTGKLYFQLGEPDPGPSWTRKEIDEEFAEKVVKGSKIPINPDKVYWKEWTGWDDFLGITNEQPRPEDSEDQNQNSKSKKETQQNG